MVLGGSSRTWRRRSQGIIRGVRGHDPRIDTLDPFPCPAGAGAGREFPRGQHGGFGAGSAALPSPEVDNSVFIALLSNKVYGTSGTHWGKNADSLYEFLIGEEEQGRPQGEFVKC